MDYGIGDVVISTKGHDRGTCYAVVATEGEMLFLANGKTRSVDMPKRKKSKHVCKVSALSASLAESLKERSGPFRKECGTSDSSLRNALKESGYNNSGIMIKRYLHEQE